MVGGVCAVCGRPVARLVRHHWYEPPLYDYHTALLCHRCNTVMLPWYLWEAVDDRISVSTREWYHVLPSLDFQREWWVLMSFVPCSTERQRKQFKKFVNQFADELRTIYGSPLPDPPVGVELK